MVAPDHDDDFDDDDPDDGLVRLPIASVAKTLGALSQCAEMYRHHADTEAEMAAEDAGYREREGVSALPEDSRFDRVKELAMAAESCGQLAMYLTTTLTDCPFTSGDVVVPVGFLDSVQRVFQDAVADEDAVLFDELLPGWFCRHWDHGLDQFGPFEGCGQSAHSLVGIIETASQECDDYAVYLDR